MNSINVFYQSRNGCTQKIAEVIAEVCGVSAVNIEIPARVSHADLIFVGMDSYNGRVDDSVYDFLDQLPVNSIRGAALFSVSKRGGNHLALVINMLEHKGIAVYPKQLLLKGKYHLSNRSHPDEDDLQAARNFAAEVLSAYNG